MVSLRNLGLAYIEEENFIEAINVFKVLIELAPNEPLGYANLGLVYLNLNEVAPKNLEAIPQKL